MTAPPPSGQRGPEAAPPWEELHIVAPLPRPETPPSAPLDPFTHRDTELEVELAAEEAARKRAEAEAGRGLEGVLYTPAPEVPRRRVWLVVALIVIVACAVWFYGLPRTDAELVVRYNEGLLGGVNVDARIENHGTRALDALTVTVAVQDSTDMPVAETYEWDGRVAAHSEEGLEAVHFQGDQWQTYHIFVSWEFDSAGQHFMGTEHLVTTGDAMNLWFSVRMD